MLEVDVFTTGQIAKLCAVDRRTVARWIDAGLLPCHRTGGGRRRVLRRDLLAFMQERGMPIPRVLTPPALRIAIVDDHRQMVTAIERIVCRVAEHADVRVAHDGFAAGALVTSFRPDLVFLDVVMPGLSGVEVCEHIRSDAGLETVSIVIVSGHLDSTLRERLLQAGADRIVAKPFSPTDITQAVLDFCGAHLEVDSRLTSMAEVASS